MKRDIVKDKAFLKQPSVPATPADLPIVQDMIDTMDAHRPNCVGIAANMIGERVCILVADNNGENLVMINPEILDRMGSYSDKEYCLCHEEPKMALRFRVIRVRYYDQDFQEHTERFRDRVAQIIQHEIDHMQGIVI